MFGKGGAAIFRPASPLGGGGGGGGQMLPVLKASAIFISSPATKSVILVAISISD